MYFIEIRYQIKRTIVHINNLIFFCIKRKTPGKIYKIVSLNC